MRTSLVAVVVVGVAMIAAAAYYAFHEPIAYSAAEANLTPHAEKKNWIAIAMAADGAWAIQAKTNKADAELAATSSCEGYANGKPCKILISSDKKGFYSVATSNTYVSMGFDPASPEAAQQGALSECVPNTSTDDVCRSQGITALGVELPAATIASNNKAAEQSPANCAPRERYTCESSCKNTSCVVRFNNGCTMQVSVSQKQEFRFGYNPASGKQENHLEWVNEDPCRVAAGY